MSKDERDKDPDDRDEDESDEEVEQEALPADDDESSAESSPPPSAKPERSDKTKTPTRRTVLVAFATGAAGGLAGGFGIGYWYAKRRRPSRRPRKPPKPAYVPVPPHSARKGPSPAKITIIEFSEFQCPYCGRAISILDDVLKKYGQDVALVFRHSPLKFHKYAMGAAIAFQAAHRQNKAWELHDLMFENRKKLAPEELVEHAAAVGLDVERFKQDIEDPALLAEVEADMKAAKEAGVTGTPAFFINGRPLRGAKPMAAFVEIIDEELRRADELIAAGTPLADVYETRAKELVAKIPPEAQPSKPAGKK